MELSKNEEDILRRLVGYGGYATKDILHLYRTDLSVDRCYRILVQLQEKGYIKERPYFESFRQPTVYQVTRKACRFYNRPDAYMRKVHKPYAVRRYLIRSHFLFQLAGRGVDISLFSSVSRQQYLNERGFTDYYLPKKINKGIETVQIEEFVIDAEPYSKKHTVCFLYVDNQSYFVRQQFENLLLRYGKMVKSGRGFVDFLIVTENEARARAFKETYEEHFLKKIFMIDVKTFSIDKTYKATV